MAELRRRRCRAGASLLLAALAAGPVAARGAAASTGGAAPLAKCPANLADRLASTSGARQLLTVEAARFGTTTALLSAWRPTAGCFVEVAGPWRATVGAAGLSDHHVEGDGSTPTGSFAIGPTMYGVAPDIGLAYPYHRLACGDWWDEDPASPHYNTFQHVACGNRPPFGGGSEALWTEVPAYEHFAVVEYNSDPVVPGRGSGIFLHVAGGGPTIGCIALPASELDRVLRWLRPGAHPRIVIGTAAEIDRF